MEIVYALHFTTSSCKDMGSSVENNAFFSLDSLTDIPFLPSIVSSFFSFLTCTSGLLYCCLKLHGDNRRRC